MSDDIIRNYVISNRFDASKLQWSDIDTTPKIHLSEDEWNMVSGIEEKMLLDYGSGYIDMGLDNFFEFDENGYMLADKERAWIAIDKQPVAYYHLSTTKNGDETITIGRGPVILNGEKANLIIIFDKEHPKGYLAGANTDYDAVQTETVAKNTPKVSYTIIQEDTEITYKFTDIYNNSYWTPVLKSK